MMMLIQAVTRSLHFKKNSEYNFGNVLLNLMRGSLIFISSFSLYFNHVIVYIYLFTQRVCYHLTCMVHCPVDTCSNENETIVGLRFV